MQEELKEMGEALCILCRIISPQHRNCKSCNNMEGYRKAISNAHAIEEERDRLKAELAEALEALEKILQVYEPYNVHGFLSPRVIEIAKAALAGKEAKIGTEYTDETANQIWVGMAGKDGDVLTQPTTTMDEAELVIMAGKEDKHEPT